MMNSNKHFTNNTCVFITTDIYIYRHCHEDYSYIPLYLMVEPYLIGSFFKLAIVKVTSHSCGIMVNLSVSGYFEVMWHFLRTYLDVFRFFCKISRLTLYLKMRVYHKSIYVFGKVQGPTSIGDLHDEYFKKHF